MVFSKVFPLAFINTLAALATSMVNVLLPQIAREAGTDMAITQWATLAFLLVSTALIVPAGWLSDRIGKTRLLRLALLLFLGASVLGTFAPNFWWFVAARALQGAGVAALLTTPLALVRQSVAPLELGAAMGIMGSAIATGMAAGPALGGLAAATPLGWRGAFSLFILLALFGLYLTARRLPASASLPSKVKLDALGLLLMIAGLSSYSVALTVQPGGRSGMLGLLAVSAVVLTLFVWRQFRTSAPLLDLRALLNAGLMPHLLLAFGAAVIMMTFTITPPFFLTNGLGLNESAMGLVMMIGPVTAMLVGVQAGRFVDRMGPGRMTILGVTLLTVASLEFTVLPTTIGLLGFVVAAVTLTPGNQLFMAANNTALMADAPERMQGGVSGAVNLGRNLGFTTGTALVAAIYQEASASMPLSDGANAGLRASFTFAMVVGLALIALAMWRHRRRRTRPVPPPL